MRVSQYLAIPPKLYKRSEAVVRSEVGELGKETGEEQHQNKQLDKSQARREGTLMRKLVQLSNIYSTDVCYIITML